MSNKTMKTTIQLRRDTTANWLANKTIVPAAGEPCFDTDLGTLKIGDGVTTYENLKEISGGMAAHYEGIRGEEETDNDVISRVTAGEDIQQGDMFIVKALIADGKYSYTAYVFDGENWAAMDGNYNASNVYFDSDFVFTTKVGTVQSLTNGSATKAAAGMNVQNFLASLFAEEANPGKSEPGVTLNCAQMGAYEVGTSVTPSYSASLSAGSYTYGPATGITAKTWSVTNGTNTLATASGTFPAITVTDSTSYSITATATYDEGAVPVTNLGNPYPAGKITAGSKSATKSKISGYRNSFYGTVESKDGEIDSAFIRKLTKSGKALAANSTMSISIPVNAIRVVFAYPATLRDVSSVVDVNGMGAEIASAFTKSVVSVEGANGYDAIDYKVYVTDFAGPNDKANTYTVKI